MKNPDWTVLENKMLEDPNLSWEAKGILAFLYSRPDDWILNETELYMHSESGVNDVQYALFQLEKHGYLREFEERNNTGEQ